MEGYWGDLLGGRLGAPSSELGPREQRLREKFKRLLNLLQTLNLWAWWGGELRRGWGWFPHWTSPTLPVLKLGAGWA